MNRPGVLPAHRRSSASTYFAREASRHRRISAKEETMSRVALNQPAPDFSLPGSDGKTYSLADYRGVKPVVIAWFPKANTKT